MKPIRLLTSGVCLLLLAADLPATPTRESWAQLFAGGNTKYQQGDYAAAERDYRQLLEYGAESGSLYYNLGNACFKQKKLGEAIYFWEKAKQQLPRDPDLRENLVLANLMLVDRIEIPADPFAIRLLDSAVHLLTVTQESRAVLILFMVANMFFGVYLLAARPRIAYRALVGSMITAGLLLLLACSLAWKVYEKNSRQEGVVIEQKVDIRSGPGTDNITVFTVHEGIKVRVRGAADGWYQITLPNGWSGWLPQGSVKIL